MAKVTIEGNIIEGTPEEIRETLLMLTAMAKEQEEQNTPDERGTLVIGGKQYKNMGKAEVLEGDYVVFLSQPHQDTVAGKPYLVDSKGMYKDDDGARLFADGWGGKDAREVYRLHSNRAPGVFKKGDLVKHGRDWFGREGIGEIVGFSPQGTPRVLGVKSDGVEQDYYVRPSKLTLVVTVENREDIGGTE